MKIGVHANESIEDIIKRKQDEFASAGMIFWGYGGTTCHPTKHVQPFVQNFADQDKTVNLYMHKMNSNHRAEPELAKEYSDDGLEWKPVPKGIKVKGSRHAMVIGALSEEEFDLNLRQLLVGAGPSRGRVGIDYIKGRVDKGVFEVANSVADQDVEEDMKHIDIVAPLLPPYAVFVR